MKHLLLALALTPAVLTTADLPPQSSQGKTHLVAEGLAFPNGVVLRPDGRTLIVGEADRNRVLVFDVLAPGKFGPQRVFATLPSKQGDQINNAPDGMALDEEGVSSSPTTGCTRCRCSAPTARYSAAIRAAI